MPDAKTDLVVIGGGAMGLATAWWAARTRRVILFERYAVGHTRGASHGEERIYRYGYTDRTYVRLVVAADEGWRTLEEESGRTLIDRLGAIDVGDEEELAAICAACTAEGVAVHWLTADEAALRWPGFRFSSPVLYQPDAGRTRAAEALDALRAVATRLGADLRFEQPVEHLEVDGDGVVVRAAGASIRAPVAVVAAGAWTADLLAGIVPLPPLTTTCEQVGFWRPRDGGRWPSFIDRGPTVWYGLPSPNGLIKLGEHHTGPITTGDTRSFAIDPTALAKGRAYVRERLRGLEPEPVSATTCLYTLTPTEDFVLDRSGPVVVGAGFSGHGFKFTPEIGRLLATMAEGADPPGPPFSIAGGAASGPIGRSGHR
jgi:sarcosine oxidase